MNIEITTINLSTSKGSLIKILTLEVKDVHYSFED
jgi:hypothetical protein